MNSRLPALTALLVLSLSLFAVAPTFASTPLCNSHLPSLTGATQVIHISYSVTNEEDASMGPWYWAMDSFTNTVTIWQLPNLSYVALKTYDGSFFVPAGAHSPTAGTLEPADGTGVIHSCYIATFSATLTLGTFANGHPVTTSGYQGSFSEGGTISDIIASYPSGTSNANPNGWSWYSNYFSGTTSFNYVYDVWTYTLTSPGISTSMTQTGAYAGPFSVSGDIITKAVPIPPPAPPQTCRPYKVYDVLFTSSNGQYVNVLQGTFTQGAYNSIKITYDSSGIPYVSFPHLTWSPGIPGKIIVQIDTGLTCPSAQK